MCNLCSVKANRITQNRLVLFCFASNSVLLIILAQKTVTMRAVAVKVRNSYFEGI